MTPYYNADGITIYHGDCREIMPKLGDVGIDLVLADPPYNVGIEYGEKTDDQRQNEIYTEWTREWAGHAFDLCGKAVVFPGYGVGLAHIPMWWSIRKPSAMGFWYKPGIMAQSWIGYADAEPYLYWGPRVGGTVTVKSSIVPTSETAGHPCPKPIDLYRKLLTKFKGTVVLDPFLGSGTTTRAAKDLGLAAIGIEIEERYCEIAAKRLAQGVLDLG